jgi:hypothetical protein
LAARAFAAPGLTDRQIFSVINLLGGSRGAFWLGLFAHGVGLMWTVSYVAAEIGSALLSPSAFAFYILVLVVIAIFWFG